ncbi:hypothetical protein ACS0TY_016152 [Phlomoides rotata]
MASSFLRNSNLRHIIHSFNSRMYSSKFGILSHDSFPNSNFASLSPENFTTNQYKLLCAFSMNRRFLCTAGATQSSGPAEGSSGNKNGEQNSGGTQNTQREGKPVRGGHVSWMSFFLLLCTRAGLVYYYDREKRRRIEGINSASNTVTQGPSVGKAVIGGPFNLIDHNGK